MPLYNTATVAVALGVSPKWLDNLLSHNKIDGVDGERQGIARRLSFDTIRTIAIARELTTALELTVPAALRLAARIVAGAEVDRSAVVSISVDLDALDRQLRAGLAHAVEVTPHPVRGRPPGARTGGSTAPCHP